MSIAKHWEWFKESGAVGRNPTAEQVERVRRVFFSGAAAMYANLRDGESKEALLQEILDFAKEMRTPDV